MAPRPRQGPPMPLGPALAGLLLAATTGSGEEAAREVARIAGAREAPQPPRLYELPRRVAAAELVRVATVRAGGTDIALYDVDGDGRFTARGVDGWRPADAAFRFALPLEDEIVLAGRPTRLAFDDSGTSVAVEQDEIPWPGGEPAGDAQARIELRRSRAEVTKALLVWNDLRVRNGLPPVRLDPALTAACMDHARYMQRHGVTHVQDPGHPAHTPEGDRVARSGSVGSLPASEEIVEVYSTFYHRISLFHPDTRAAGIGSVGGRSIFNGTEDRRQRAWTWPVAIPAPGTEDVPRTYHAEKPVPHPNEMRDGTIQGGGFPVTLTFERDEVADVAAALRVGDGDGRDVPFSLSWPARPASSDAPTNYKTICLLPHTALRPRTTYWVHVEWTYRGEIDQRTWTFRTGR